MEDLPPHMQQLLLAQAEQIRHLQQQLEAAQNREIGEIGDPQQQETSAEQAELQQWVGEEWDNFSGGGTPQGEVEQQTEQSSAPTDIAARSEMAKVSEQQHTSHTLHALQSIEGRPMLSVTTVEAELLRNAQPGVGGNTVHTVPTIVGISGNSSVFDDPEISQHGSSTSSLPTAVLFEGAPEDEISPGHTPSGGSQDTSTAGSATGGAGKGHDGAIYGVSFVSSSPCASGRPSVTLLDSTGGALAKFGRSVTSGVTLSPEHRNGAFHTPQQVPAGQGVEGVQPEDGEARWAEHSPVSQQKWEAAVQENPDIQSAFRPRISKQEITREIALSQVGVAYQGGGPVAIYITTAGTTEKLHLNTFLNARGVTVEWLTLQNGELPEGVPLIDLDPARYAALVNNVITSEQLQHCWVELANIAVQNDSPESVCTAKALQQVHVSDFKMFLTKLVILSQNWEHAPALRATLGNWACDAFFDEALRLVKMELAQHRDTAWRATDHHAEIAQAVEKLKSKQYAEQRRKADIALSNATGGKMEHTKQQMLQSVGEQLNEPVATVPVKTNGHCLAAAFAMATFGSSSLTPVVVKRVIECYRTDPHFEKELHTAMELQGLMEEEDTRSFEERVNIFLNGLLTGEIWMDQPDLSLLCRLYQTQVLVWQFNQDGEPKGVAVPQIQSALPFPTMVHLFLRDGHYEPLVSMDVLHQFARSETDVLPNFSTTHTTQEVMDRHAPLRLEAQAAAATETAVGAGVAVPTLQSALEKSTLGSTTQPRQRLHTTTATATPMPKGRGAYRKGASPMLQPESTKCTNQFAALASPSAEETPVIDSYTAGGSMDAGQGSGGVNTYSTAVMPRSFRAHEDVSPVPFPNGRSETPLGFPSGLTQRARNSSGRGGYRNMGTRTQQMSVPKVAIRNQECIDRLQALTTDADAKVALKAWYYTNGTHGQVQGRLTVQGPATGLRDLAVLLRGHCPMALLCNQADKQFYNIQDKGCLEAEKRSMKAHERYLWHVEEVMDIIEKT